jgi:UDP-N-acetylglucosamine transferase subunit ALG13
MIFVTLGTSEPFNRLLAGLDPLPADEEIVVQLGASTVRPVGARCVEFLAYDEVIDLMRRARVVVTHAGAGSVLAARGQGKVPVVVPRLRRHGEAVDDHQVQFGRRLHRAGLVTLVEDPASLPAALQAGTATPVPAAVPGRLVEELRSYLRERLG